MSNAEDIARDHLFDEMEEVNHFEKHEWTPPEWLLKAMENYKSEALQELKERAKGLDTFDTWDEAGKQVLTNKEQVVRLEDVIETIEDMQDE